MALCRAAINVLSCQCRTAGALPVKLALQRKLEPAVSDRQVPAEVARLIPAFGRWLTALLAILIEVQLQTIFVPPLTILRLGRQQITSGR